MSLRVIPLRIEHLDQNRPVWLPFLERVAAEQHCFLEQRLAEVYSGEVSLVVVWNDDKKEPAALLGYSLVRRGADNILRLVMLATDGDIEMKDLLALYEVVEGWAERAGCQGMSAVVRPGYSPFMKAKGYKLKHVEYEKDFDAKHHHNVGNGAAKPVPSGEQHDSEPVRPH